jgi:hypothetical protein
MEAEMKEHDLRGKIPEIWACIDCGVNTHPGSLNREQMEQAFVRDFGDEGVTITFDEFTEVYMVKPKIWEAAGMEPMGGCLCIACLERRIGRTLTARDFVRNDRFSSVPGTKGCWHDVTGERGQARRTAGNDQPPVGASLNAGDNLAVRGDTTGERCAAQHREGPPCDFFHRSCLDVQLVVTRRTFVALERPFPWYRMLGHPVSDANHRRAYRTRGWAQNSHSGRCLGLSPDHAATAQGLLYRYSETMLQGPALRTNR